MTRPSPTAGSSGPSGGSLRLRNPLLKREVQDSSKLSLVFWLSWRSEAPGACLTWRRRKRPPRGLWKSHWPRRSPGRLGRRRPRACRRWSDSAPPRSAPPVPSPSSAGRSDKENGHGVCYLGLTALPALPMASLCRGVGVPAQVGAVARRGGEQGPGTCYMHAGASLGFSEHILQDFSLDTSLFSLEIMG